MNDRIHLLDEDPLGRQLRAEALSDRPTYSAALHAKIMSAIEGQHIGSNADGRSGTIVFRNWRFAASLSAAVAAVLLIGVAFYLSGLMGNVDHLGGSATRQAITSADIAVTMAIEEALAAESAAADLSNSLVLAHWDYAERNAGEIVAFLLDPLHIDVPQDVTSLSK
jgi:hypothetical protein